MSILDNIYNYYEKLVLEELAEQAAESESMNEDYLADTVCVALNTLPPKYFRHGVDMAFYLTSEEAIQMRQEVKRAVQKAVEYMKKSSRVS